MQLHHYVMHWGHFSTSQHCERCICKTIINASHPHRKGLGLLSEFEQFSPIKFGDTRKAPRLHFIPIQVSSVLNRKLRSAHALWQPSLTTTTTIKVWYCGKHCTYISIIHNSHYISVLSAMLGHCCFFVSMFSKWFISRQGWFCTSLIAQYLVCCLYIN